IDPGIAPGNEPYSRFHQAPYQVETVGLSLEMGCGPGLIWVLCQQLAPAPKEGRAHVNPCIRNAPALLWLILYTTGVQERAVLDGRDVCRDRREHPWCAVDVRRHPFVEASRLLGEGAQFGFRILRGEGIGARGRAPSSRKYLDKICPGFHLGA